MDKHLIAVFQGLHQAEEAFHELLTIVPRDHISFIHKQQDGKEIEEASLDHPLNSILTGGALGGVRGAIFGMSTFLFPGMGVLLAAGPLYGGIASMTSGGISGGLVDLGINRYEAENIEEHLKRGSVIVTVEVKNSQFQAVFDLLKKYHPAYLSEETISPDGYQ
ncbi:DUF1269 domain-containing protein [Salipaludibacillus daqingensis]|uniref:DUF1269 domain-containing protein n=1 Tax=Salipaludibacillus daqingensis TaxID=3041001 RepID=UPI002473BA29|nr:DUF1269 domain-containing protein [Salipaludibacillus daqingensis]